MDAQNAAFLLDRINLCPFNKHNNIRAVDVDEGYSKIIADLTADSANIWGMPHGGLLFALGDVAAGLAGQSYGQRRVVTASGNINFLKGSSGGKQLTATAQAVKSGNSIGFFQVDIRDEKDELIASGQYIMHFAPIRE